MGRFLRGFGELMTECLLWSMDSQSKSKVFRLRSCHFKKNWKYSARVSNNRVAMCISHRGLSLQMRKRGSFLAHLADFRGLLGPVDRIVQFLSNRRLLDGLVLLNQIRFRRRDLHLAQMLLLCVHFQFFRCPRVKQLHVILQNTYCILFIMRRGIDLWNVFLIKTATK